MLGDCFEVLIMNKYRSYDIPSNVFKYVHYDLTNARGFRTITLMVGSNCLTAFKDWMLGHLFAFRILESLSKTNLSARHGVLSWGLGKHYNRPSRSISYHTRVCFDTFHIGIYVEMRLGRIRHSRGCGHQYLW